MCTRVCVCHLLELFARFPMKLFLFFLSSFHGMVVCGLIIVDLCNWDGRRERTGKRGMVFLIRVKGDSSLSHVRHQREKNKKAEESCSLWRGMEKKINVQRKVKT